MARHSSAMFHRTASGGYGATLVILDSYVRVEFAVTYEPERACVRVALERVCSPAFRHLSPEISAWIEAHERELADAVGMLS